MKQASRILISLIFISIGLFQSCQKSEFMVVTGVVRDSLTNQPVEGAYIATSSGQFFRSASDGTFTMDGIQPGKTEFYITCHQNVGYKPSSKTVNITNGRVNKVDFLIIPFQTPEIETGKITNRFNSTARVEGKINLDPGIGITAYGHCWSYTNSLPTLEESMGSTSYTGSNGSISFGSNMTGLQFDIVYYVRAYVKTNTGKLLYGNTVAFRLNINELNTGLLSYFPFDGNYTDESGYGTWLIPDWGRAWPAFVQDRFGHSNKACRFSNLVDLYGPYQFPGLYDFSVSLWFKKTNVWENEEQHMFLIGEGSENRFYVAQQTSPEKFTCGIRVNSTNYKIAINQYPTINVWHNVIAMRKGAEFILYLDGVLKGKINCPTNLLPPTNWIDIGAGWVTNNYIYQQFYGDMDEVRIYNRALNSSEIEYLSSH